MLIRDLSTHFRPHHIDKACHSARVLLCIKNFAAIKNVCHIGLGITAVNTMKVLRKQGYYVEVVTAQTTPELREKLEVIIEDTLKHGKLPVSHAIISAPSWVQPIDFKMLALDYPDIDWVQLNHSGCAYLSIDKYGIKNIREVSGLSQEHHNIKVAGNNPRFVQWMNRTIGPCLHIPNLYDTDSFVKPYVMKKDWGDTLRVGSFGASRPWKNQLTSAESAVQLAKTLGCKLEFFVNSKRPDGGERMVESRLELFDGMRDCKIIDVPWEKWPDFRKTVGTMHLMYSASFDETYCVVVADGIAEGVASVVSPGIEWCPPSWQAEPCDPNDLTKTALHLLHDPHAVEDGRDHLIKYTNNGIELWKNYLGR